jgi:hypothetical protein
MTALFRRVACAAVFLAALLSWQVALGAEPRPGLWTMTMTSDLSGMEMPEMPELSPEVLAQMQAMGIEMPNLDFSQPRTTTVQTCVTPEDIANRNQFDTGTDMDDDCRQENLQTSDTGMSMDLICTGTMNGTGRIEYVFESDTSYSGTMTFQGTSGGQVANMNNTMQGNWVSADCGGVAP